MSKSWFGKFGKGAAGVGLAAAMAMTGGLAQANTITSDDPDCVGAPTGRTFSVTATTVVKCLAKGVGNLSGNGDDINNLGYVTLDKSDSGGDLLDGVLTGVPSLVAGLSGTFSIAASVFTTYDNVVIAFKTGVGALDPDWAGFLLANNTTSGTWSISGAQQLSHAVLYGKLIGGGGGGGGVPEPASLALVGLALLGVAAARRKSV